VQKAKSLNPDNLSVLDTMGWISYRKGEINQAIEWLGKAQTGNAGNPIVNYHLGMAYYKAGNSGKAKEYLRTALAAKVVFPGKDEAEKTMASIR
ncbi:MAG: tetratricopeptide repeat protein, partial [Nitrospirae bacterium]|nr:tetratricopeptide repeat protein [Nitrospirota bacterium]